jgi:hypothetical protein|nr:hypothetical protein [uncultured Flavobacterium sp.]
MNCKISFQERAKLSIEQLAKQPPITLEGARAQAEWFKNNCVSLDKKNRV